jgi:predicted nuclease of predicted toxin-antitoxin system
MKFLVDAHLPRRLCTMLAQHGHNAMHTLDLPAANKTKDRIINQLSFDEQRVVVTKDTDF